MQSDHESLQVPIDAFTMQLRPSEVEAVALGMPGDVEALAGNVQAERLPAAVRALPGSDRAPLWELAIRHYARGKPVDQAAAEIGMDPLHAHALLAAFRTALLEI